MKISELAKRFRTETVVLYLRKFSVSSALVTDLIFLKTTTFAADKVYCYWVCALNRIKRGLVKPEVNLTFLSTMEIIWFLEIALFTIKIT